MRFEFATATRIIFGPGTLSELGHNASQLGHRALVVTGRSVQRAEPILRRLAGHGVEYVPFSVAGEPTTDEVILGVQRAREKECDFVVGCGGGSAIDAAKAIAALLTNPGHLVDYLEVVGLGRALTMPAAPCLTIPTTAGTGAEVTRNSVLTSLVDGVKASARSPLMLPRLALIDPELTFPLPREITATTGLDALTQLIEPYVSGRANPLTDALCLEGMRRVARSLRHAWEDPVNPGAREDMSLASLFGGLALANAGLGAVHGFAAPIGGMFRAPHGAVCAALLPHVMEANLVALREREPRHASLPRYTEIARCLTGAPDARAEDGITWVRELCATLQIPALSAHEVDVTDIPAIVEKAAQASSMKANPIALTVEELQSILARAL